MLWVLFGYLLEPALKPEMILHFNSAFVSCGSDAQTQGPHTRQASTLCPRLSQPICSLWRQSFTLTEASPELLAILLPQPPEY